MKIEKFDLVLAVFAAGCLVAGGAISTYLETTYLRPPTPADIIASRLHPQTWNGQAPPSTDTRYHLWLKGRG